ncbi:hypothetical protein CBR_g55538 [Chara braunii]|uniref:CCHC-type domain-containing protein n=1 Tax=Chara braunii TaxID=69332 RepID=A0A388MD18_CHABU|nr:hypothetical protein CBR_g55538 [Chara braunii]|eukprot:GBG92457.1 hypothetical protein CBR_g55538 [Chara braunii]
MAAGVSAGLNVLRLISEPTAAALAYGHQRLIGNKTVGGDSAVNGHPPVIRSSYGGGSRYGERCWECDELGHYKRDCPNMACWRCGEVRHFKLDCRNYDRWDEYRESLIRRAVDAVGKNVPVSKMCGGTSDVSVVVGKNVLVFDMGGGTFDVSIVTMKEGTQNDFTFVVKAVAGDSHLGGTDIDKRLLQHVAEQFRSQLEREDLLVKPRIRKKLNQLVVDAKHDLSVKTEAEIDLDCGGDDILTVRLERTKFEALNQDLFHRCMTIVEQALRDAKISKGEISEVLLAGGSTRTPKLQEMLMAFFGKPPIKSVNPDEAVAFGAAVQAGLLARRDKFAKASISVCDVTSVSIAVETRFGVMHVVIPRNSPLPASESAYFVLLDFQKSAWTALYEGDRALCQNNRLLGELKLDGFTPCLATLDRSIEAVIKIDENGILHATAEAIANHEDIGRKVETTVTLDTDFVQDSANIREETDWYMPQAKAEDAKIWAAKSSENRLWKLIVGLRVQGSSSMGHTDLEKHVSEAWAWFSEHKELALKEEYNRRYEELELLAKLQNLAVI